MKKGFLLFTILSSFVIGMISPITAHALNESKLKESSIELKQGDESSPNDYSFISKEIQGKSLIAIGDTNCSIKELTESKHNLTKYLIEKQGYRTIVLETSLSTTDELNAYINGDAQRVEPAISKLDTWQLATDEFVAFIEWVKEFNASTSKENKVVFSGYTTKNLEAVNEGVIDYITKYDPSMESEYKTVLRKLIALMGEYKNNVDPTEQVNGVERLYADFTSKKAEYISKSSELEYNRNLLSFTKIREVLTNYAKGQSIFKSYEITADTLKYVKDNSKDGKCILWTSNRNLLNTNSGTNGFGYYLNDLFKESIYKVSTAFGTGTYLSRSDTYQNRDVTQEKVNESNDSIGKLLNSSDFNQSFINLKNMKSSTPSIYSIYSVEDMIMQKDYVTNVPHDMNTDFDIIIYVKEGTNDKNFKLVVKGEDIPTDPFLVVLIIFMIGSLVVSIIWDKRNEKKMKETEAALIAEEDEFSW